MLEGQDRVSAEHVWAGILHHRANYVPHIRMVAVHRTKSAGGLILLEGAFLQAFRSIVEQSFAINAEPGLGSMPGVTMHQDHGLDGAAFPFHPFARMRHEKSPGHYTLIHMNCE